MQRFQALATLNQTLLKSGKDSLEFKHSRHQSLDIEEGKVAMSPCSSNYDAGQTLSRHSSCKSLPTDNQSYISDQASTSDMATNYYSSESQVVFLMIIIDLLSAVFYDG